MTHAGNMLASQVHARHSSTAARGVVRDGAAWAHAMPGWLLAQVCTETYGFSADVVCTGNLHTSMPYIPIHCDYMCAAPLVAL